MSLAMNKAGNNNKSLWEQSMKMAANIIKVSSFSIAEVSLGTARPPEATNKLAAKTGSAAVPNKPLQPQFPESLRSQKPESSSKPKSYLLEPVKSVKGLADKKLAPKTGSAPDANKPLLPQFPGSLSSQKPESSSSPKSLLPEPVEDVDGGAENYIRKVHEKNLKDLDEISTSSEDILSAYRKVK